MIIRSSDAPQATAPSHSLSSQEQDQANLLLITNTIEKLRKENPDLYARLQTDKRFRRLPHAPEPERSELLSWFLSEVSTVQPSLFQGIKKLFRGK